MEEIFKPIRGFEGLYEVSNFGRVMSIRRGIFLKGKVDKDGYIEYCLRYNGKAKHKRGHRLVAEAFIPNPNNLPVINHKDHSKDNNRVDNLEWCTVMENTKYYYSGPNYKEGSHRMLSSLSNEDLVELVRLYVEDKYDYTKLYDRFGLKCRQDELGEVLSGRRFSEITGIKEDVRRPYEHPSLLVSNQKLNTILEDYYFKGLSRQDIKAKYEVTDKWMSVVFSGKLRVKEVEIFANSKGMPLDSLLFGGIRCE